MKRAIRLLKPGLPIAALVGIGGYAISKCLYNVEGGCRAIKFNRFFGVLSKHHREGWHLFLPYFEWPIIYDVRTQAKLAESITGSKD